MTSIGAEALAVVGKPDSWVMIFGAREEKIALTVVFEESQGPLVPLHQNWPHLTVPSALSHSPVVDELNDGANQDITLIRTAICRVLPVTGLTLGEKGLAFGDMGWIIFLVSGS